MRTNEQRINLMHQRAQQIKKENRIKTIEIISLVFCLIVVTLFAINVPLVADHSLYNNIPSGMHGSIFSHTQELSMIIVALLSFLLGISITIFCYYLRKNNGN